MKRSLAILALLLPMSAALAQFDHSYGSWNALLKKHVVLINYGKASQVRYADFAKDRPALKAYLDSVSKVTDAEFKSWSKPAMGRSLSRQYRLWLPSTSAWASHLLPDPQ